MKLQYFKTDRNGTKYYYDCTCSRCGGAGESDNWWRTGKLCYECGGTGKRRNPKIVKEYTPEYQAKLIERRKAKLQANEPTEEEKAEMQRRNEEAKVHQREMLFEEYGCDKNGHGFVYIGKTFKYKDLFRNVGGKWLQTFQFWICPERIKVDNAIKVIEVDISNKVDFKNQALGDAYEYLLYLV